MNKLFNLAIVALYISIPNNYLKKSIQEKNDLIKTSEYSQKVYYYYYKVYCSNSSFVYESSYKFEISENYIEMYISGNGGYWITVGNGCKIINYERTTIDGFTGDAYECSNGDIYFFFYSDGTSKLAIFDDSGNCEMYSS
ncbi:MAG: hypothetical protein N2167_10735 [Flavobacteriales bacterium]|nr:hypothetical protein [Flavobacteriales bacterium]